VPLRKEKAKGGGGGGRGQRAVFFLLPMYSQNDRLKIKKCDNHMLLEIFDRKNNKKNQEKIARFL
jgi:hypothetical protein